MNIEVTTKKSEGVERTLQVSVALEDVRAAEDKATKHYATQARLPGFRPGKAPAAMVRKRFNDAIRSEALNSLVEAALKEVAERENLKLAGQPHIHELNFAEGKPLTFELHLEVAPEIELSRVSGFRVQRPPTDVSDEQVREQLEHLRDQKATWAPVDDRVVSGDLVKVLLAISGDAGDIPEAGEHSLVLGTGQAIPGVEQLIIDTPVGGNVERPVQWPEDFPDESQRGVTKTVNVTLLEAKRKQPPELDDSFAREVGDFDTLDDLMKAIREDLRSHAERTADAEVRTRLLDEILAANPFDIPRAWVAELVRAYAQSYQIPEQELDRFAADFWPAAERQVRRETVVETIAKKEGLEATEADIDNRVTEVAQRRNADAGQVYASLQKSGRLRELQRGITDDKVFAWLLERNTVE
jgi:trigger factor